MRTTIKKYSKEIAGTIALVVLWTPVFIMAVNELTK